MRLVLLFTSAHRPARVVVSTPFRLKRHRWLRRLLHLAKYTAPLESWSMHLRFAAATCQRPLASMRNLCFGDPWQLLESK
mmetsp:Transcript_68564/g.192172  ORF Transcript_68564/g.192172 Transcript_68564/m.192172 type:complete len:80 (-) Transcript_68564:43-282(-)